MIKYCSEQAKGCKYLTCLCPFCICVYEEEQISKGKAEENVSHTLLASQGL
jgi:hypothetical protein